METTNQITPEPRETFAPELFIDRIAESDLLHLVGKAFWVRHPAFMLPMLVKVLSFHNEQVHFNTGDGWDSADGIKIALVETIFTKTHFFTDVLFTNIEAYTNYYGNKQH